MYRKGGLTWHPPLTKFELQVLTSSVYDKHGGGQCSPGNKLRTIHQREILDTLNILHFRKSLLMSIPPTHNSPITSQILFIDKKQHIEWSNRIACSRGVERGDRSDWEWIGT
jgi:hypothetical protein